MGAKFVLPEGWVPTFKQEHKMDGDKSFEIWLRYEGQVGDANMHNWIFALVYKGVILDAGPFYWDPSDQPLKDVDVARHTVNYYKTMDLDEMHKEYMREEMALLGAVDKEGFPPEVRAVALVNALFFSSVDVDFEITYYVQVSDSWKVVITNNLDERHFEVVYDSKKQETYISAHDLVDDYKLVDGTDTPIQGPFIQ